MMFLFQGFCPNDEFDCGEGVCSETVAKCDGFVDCPQRPVDEMWCGKRNKESRKMCPVSFFTVLRVVTQHYNT